MKKLLYLLCLVAYVAPLQLLAQRGQHTEQFEQLEEILPDPNRYRSASGAPGPDYWQNTANYDIAVRLNEDTHAIEGDETITYFNNSPDPLPYLWVQLDQNVRDELSHSYSTQTNQVVHNMPGWYMGRLVTPTFEGGFNLHYVTDMQNQPLKYVVNKTMMRIDLPETLMPGESVQFKIGWDYNINDRMQLGGRSGYEGFDDGNTIYTIAQFFPRMCVYNDYAGWMNKQFLGGGEFTLPFGDYRVEITVPADHIMEATGQLQNANDVLTRQQRNRMAKAEKEFEEPVFIVTKEEATEAEAKRSKKMKTWVYEADSVRDFAFATSRKFIWDAMNVKLPNGTTSMATSLYPKEAWTLWDVYSTKVVAHTMRVYSRYTFSYPYPKAVSVHTARIGMEYPMICFNYGRPDAEGNIPDRVKYGMIGVIVHEVGHNFFPMIVNSDERQWTWMDEGLNTFVEYLTEVEFPDVFGEPFPANDAVPANIVPYMSRPKERLSPIMTNSEQVQSLGPNAYTKPATGLNILRETIMGRELFDMAFKTYSQRWMFKHPTPSDFFRTMEDASAVDLDWYWRGWFYGVDPVDIALTKVRALRMRGEAYDSVPDGFSDESEDADSFLEFYAEGDYDPNQFYYELSFENEGGLPMPLLIQFNFEDNTTEMVRIPAEIWRKNSKEVSKVFIMDKKVTQIVLDPELETADIDLQDNYWPRKVAPTKFEEFLKEEGR